MAGPFDSPFDGITSRGLPEVLTITGETQGHDITITLGDVVKGEDAALTSGLDGEALTLRGGNADQFPGAQKDGGNLYLAPGSGSPASKFFPAGDPGDIFLAGETSFVNHNLRGINSLRLTHNYGTFDPTGINESVIYVDQYTGNPYYVPESAGEEREIRTGMLEPEKLWLHPLQFEEFGIRPAAVLVFDSTVTTNVPNDGDTFVLSDSGIPDEVFTFRTVPAGGNDVQIGSTTYITLENLAGVVAANGMEWAAVMVSDLERFVTSAGNNRMMVVVRLNPGSTLARAWGVINSTTQARLSIFTSGDPDYSEYGASSLDPTDPGINRGFGPGKQGIFFGGHTTLSNPQTLFRMNRLPTYDSGWIRSDGPRFVKQPCRMATTGNQTLAGFATVDGVSGVVGDRILVWQQTNAAENGIYILDPGHWIRSDDFTYTSFVEAGVETFVQEGTQYGLTRFTLVTTGAITLGTTGLTFTPGGPLVRTDTVETQIKGAGAFTVGTSYTPTILTVGNYDDVDVYIEVTDKTGINTITCVMQHTSEATPTNWSGLGSDDTIVAGAATLAEYTTTWDVSSGYTAPFRVHWNFPRRGLKMRFGIRANAAGGSYRVLAIRNVRGA